MKKGLSIMAFGTSHYDAYKSSISKIYHWAKENLDIEVEKGMTSRFIQKKLLREYDEFVPNEAESVDILRNEGCDRIYIQPLHLLKGLEYEKLRLPDVILGSPLFETEEDIIKFVQRVDLNVPKDEFILMMGHGSPSESEWIYERLEEELRNNGYKNLYIGTVEGTVTIDEILPKLLEQNAKIVYLLPLMLVAGDHAKNDMAGDEDDSWKSILEKNGMEVTVILKGIGEYEEVRELYYDKIRELINK